MRLDQAAPLVGGTWAAGDRRSDTVGAYIIESLQRVPEPGEQVVVDGIPVEIEAEDGGIITSVIIGERPRVNEDEAK
jgi:CBS domain containing-hemolysin-like protein